MRPAREVRRLERDLADILYEAADALIAQLQDVGIDDPADIARRLNRRGFPCFGRRRWSTSAVAAICRRRLQADRAA